MPRTPLPLCCQAAICSAAVSSSWLVRLRPVSNADEAAPSDHQSVQSPRQTGSVSPWRSRRIVPNALGVVKTIRGDLPAAFHSRANSLIRSSGGPLSTRTGCVDSM